MTNFGTYSRLRFDVEASVFSGVVDEGLTLVTEGNVRAGCESQADMTFDVIPRLENKKVDVSRCWRQGNDG